MNRKPDPRSQIGILNEIGGSIYHSVGQMRLPINTSDNQIVECESGTRIAAAENSTDEKILQYNSESGKQIASA
jgi:hypothetical protein